MPRSQPNGAPVTTLWSPWVLSSGRYSKSARSTLVVHLSGRTPARRAVCTLHVCCGNPQRTWSPTAERGRTRKTLLYLSDVFPGNCFKRKVQNEKVVAHLHPRTRPRKRADRCDAEALTILSVHHPKLTGRRRPRPRRRCPRHRRRFPMRRPPLSPPHPPKQTCTGILSSPHPRRTAVASGLASPWPL